MPSSQQLDGGDPARQALILARAYPWVAGLPRPVIERAGRSWRLRLFADEAPPVEEQRGLDIASLSPLEAVNKPFE